MARFDPTPAIRGPELLASLKVRWDLRRHSKSLIWWSTSLLMRLEGSGPREYRTMDPGIFGDMKPYFWHTLFKSWHVLTLQQAEQEHWKFFTEFKGAELLHPEETSRVSQHGFLVVSRSFVHIGPWGSHQPRAGWPQGVSDRQGIAGWPCCEAEPTDPIAVGWCAPLRRVPLPGLRGYGVGIGQVWCWRLSSGDAPSWAFWYHSRSKSPALGFRVVLLWVSAGSGHLDARLWLLHQKCRWSSQESGQKAVVSRSLGHGLLRAEAGICRIRQSHGTSARYSHLDRQQRGGDWPGEQVRTLATALVFFSLFLSLAHWRTSALRNSHSPSRTCSRYRFQWTFRLFLQLWFWMDSIQSGVVSSLDLSVDGIVWFPTTKPLATTALEFSSRFLCSTTICSGNSKAWRWKAPKCWQSRSRFEVHKGAANVESTRPQLPESNLCEFARPCNSLGSAGLCRDLCFYGCGVDGFRPPALLGSRRCGSPWYGFTWCLFECGKICSNLCPESSTQTTCHREGICTLPNPAEALWSESLPAVDLGWNPCMECPGTDHHWATAALGRGSRLGHGNQISRHGSWRQKGWSFNGTNCFEVTWATIRCLALAVFPTERAEYVDRGA